MQGALDVTALPTRLSGILFLPGASCLRLPAGETQPFLPPEVCAASPRAGTARDQFSASSSTSPDS